MNRKETTEFLSKLLVSHRLNARGKYYASEVTFDWGKQRVDFMEFVPQNQSTSGIEHGEFICYEVKSCKADYNSGNGLNFEGERNYIVTTMETYKQIIHDIPWHIGVIVACPWNRKPTDEFENPTPLDDKSVKEWETKIIKPAHPKYRKRSMSQLLFYMLRSGK